MSALDQAQLRHLKDQLIKELEELQQAAARGQESTRPVELDQQSVGRISRIDALQVQAMAQERARRGRQRMVHIHAALSRIEDDEFGYCTSCGEPVATKRLELDPATPECVSCAGMN